jgi:hypothetical protein
MVEDDSPTISSSGVSGSQHTPAIYGRAQSVQLDRPAQWVATLRFAGRHQRLAPAQLRPALLPKRKPATVNVRLATQLLGNDSGSATSVVRDAYVSSVAVATHVSAETPPFMGRQNSAPARARRPDFAFPVERSAPPQLT